MFNYEKEQGSNSESFCGHSHKALEESLSHRSDETPNDIVMQSSWKMLTFHSRILSLMSQIRIRYCTEKSCSNPFGLYARPPHYYHAASPIMMKGASTLGKGASLLEFIKFNIDGNTSVQTLDTVTSDASVITEAEAHVQFSKQVGVSQIMHLAQYTQEEIEATWYQEKEYTRISNICIKTVHKLEKRRKRSLKKREIESRGLEGHTTTGIISKTESRRLAYEKIFHEQEHQRCRGIYDDEAIAGSYQTVSSSCALWARQVALRDQRDAADYLDE
jgi:hypothetical protein